MSKNQKKKQAKREAVSHTLAWAAITAAFVALPLIAANLLGMPHLSNGWGLALFPGLMFFFSFAHEGYYPNAPGCSWLD